MSAERESELTQERTIFPSSISITAVPVHRASFPPTVASYEICATTLLFWQMRSSTTIVIFVIASRRLSAICMYASTPGVGLGWEGSIKM